MRWLFWLLVTVIVAIIVSLFAGNHDGYVLIVREPYRLELSFNLLIILIIISFFTLHFGLRFIAYARRLPASVRAYRENKRHKEGQQALLASLHALIDGRHQMAEKFAARSLALGVDAGLSTLIAARAAHRLQHKTRRDFYLAESERLAPEATNTRLLTQAEMLVDEKEYDAAIQVLEKLERIQNQHPPALRLQLQAQLGLKAWEQVLILLQQLEKKAALDTSKIREYRQEAHLQLIEKFSKNPNQLLNFWQNISQEDALNPNIVKQAAQTFIHLGLSKNAIAILQNSLAKTWDSQLVKLLGDCTYEDPQAALQQTELWLQTHEGDAGLLYTLGKLCSQLNLDQKALTYLTASLNLNDSNATHIALATIYERQGNLQASIAQYKLAYRLTL